MANLGRTIDIVSGSLLFDVPDLSLRSLTADTALLDPELFSIRAEPMR